MRYFGGPYVKILLAGENYDEALFLAKEYGEKTKAIYIHGFNDEKITAGQATVGEEIYEQLEGKN